MNIGILYGREDTNNGVLIPVMFPVVFECQLTNQGADPQGGQREHVAPNTENHKTFPLNK